MKRRSFRVETLIACWTVSFDEVLQIPNLQLPPHVEVASQPRKALPHRHGCQEAVSKTVEKRYLPVSYDFPQLNSLLHLRKRQPVK